MFKVILILLVVKIIIDMGWVKEVKEHVPLWVMAMLISIVVLSGFWAILLYVNAHQMFASLSDFKLAIILLPIGALWYFIELIKAFFAISFFGRLLGPYSPKGFVIDLSYWIMVFADALLYLIIIAIIAYFFAGKSFKGFVAMTFLINIVLCLFIVVGNVLIHKYGPPSTPPLKTLNPNH